MSRDAKVGLVIVFAFVFLFGTILVHRLHSTTPEPGKLDDDSVASKGDSDKSSGGSRPVDVRSGGTQTGNEATTVEAVPDEPLQPQRSNQRLAPRDDAIFAGQPRSSIQQGSFDAPNELPPSSTNSGGRISVLDPDERRPRAAAVESSGTWSTDRSRVPANVEDDPPTMPAEVAGSGRPPGRIHEIPANSKPVNTPDTEAETEAGTAEPTEEQVASMPDTGSDAVILEGGNSRPSESIVRGDPDDGPDEPRPPIRQAVNDEGLEDQAPRPPQLPGRPGRAEPTIESVPEEPTPPGRATEPITPPATTDPPPKSPVNPSRTDIAMDNTAGPSARSKPGAAIDNRSASETPYVVQDGDSFWTISAKFYTTGKYFRELEEYNADRLQPPASGTGKKVLRPGTTILVPDVATLKAKKNRATPATAAPSSPPNPNPSRPTAKPERPAPPAKTDSPHGSTMYRVREFDTLMSISQEKLGTTKRWKEILQLNGDKLSNERQLRPGMELRIPPLGAGEKTTERPVAGR